VLYIVSNMKTIAITIDEETLERLDRLLAAGAGDPKANRSRAIRRAVQDFVSRLEGAADAEREALVLRRHRQRLAREARALVRSQAKA
jgi:metal-responsive CopG/Arc/MetJ family transcriptional regulator